MIVSFQNDITNARPLDARFNMILLPGQRSSELVRFGGQWL
jgi:hypothetical protein